jgi:predicted histidine transporter YuiF (NhaC family)
MAEVVSLHRSGVAAALSLSAAVEGFLAGMDLAASTRAVYEGT